MNDSWESLRWDIKSLIVVANILGCFIVITVVSVFIGANTILAVTSSIIFLSIGILSVGFAFAPNLQANTKGLISMILFSLGFAIILVLFMPIQVDVWSEVISLLGLFIAVIVSIVRYFIQLDQEQSYKNVDIRNRMRKWSHSDQFKDLTEEEAKEIRAVFDKHQI
ncbi:hypothetical protein [Alkalibacillus haloalkaliphilus]|uniref:hypothetical protein n=1 Tax=Alkalibacillus haloalkaliphilus TaxID=94136 RepID=UPI0002FC94B9|nr:hypothetical protein [Alkalibacillus haloalkaliphilus]